MGGLRFRPIPARQSCHSQSCHDVSKRKVEKSQSPFPDNPGGQRCRRPLTGPGKQKSPHPPGQAHKAFRFLRHPKFPSKMHLWSKLSNVKWEDAWEERFRAHPGLVITRVGGKTAIRVELYCETAAEAETIREMWGGSVRSVAEQNWMAQVLPRIEPIKIRDSLLIVSDSEPAELADHRAAHPRRHILSIPIEMAFGTGDHATTASVLRLLVNEGRRRAPGWSCADIGCGTGVLAIAAAKLGAAAVEGFDYDPHAVEASRRNATRNGVQGDFAQLDLKRWRPRKKYDVLCANVFADVLSAGMPTLARALQTGGTLLLSGILKTHLPQVLAALETNGLRVLHHLSKGKWQTLAAGKAGILPAPSGGAPRDF